EPVVPGGPDLAADAGDAFAQTHGGRFFAGDASEHFLRLPGDVHRAFVEEGDQGGQSAGVAGEEEALGGAPGDAWVGILGGGLGGLAVGEGGAGDARRRRRARHRVLLRQRLDDDVVRGAAALRVAQTDRRERRHEGVVNLRVSDEGRVGEESLRGAVGFAGGDEAQGRERQRRVFLERESFQAAFHARRHFQVRVAEGLLQEGRDERPGGY